MASRTKAAATSICNSARPTEANRGRAGGRWVPCLCALAWLVVPPFVFAQSEEEPEGQPAIASRADVIQAIEFHGNKVTRRRILLQEMLIKVGDVADPALIERSRQAIMNLGLFTSVVAATEPRDDGVVLHLHVKEKYYILPVPKLNRDDYNNISYGAEITADNLFGLNQQLKLRYETEDAVTVTEGEVVNYLLGYSYPRVLGSAWSLGAEAVLTRQPVESSASVYEQDAWSAAFRLSRWLNLRGPSRGWQIGSGLVWRQNSYEYRSGPLTDGFVAASTVGVPVSVQFIDVNDYLYSRSGMDYGYIGELGAPVLGSDTHYNRHEIYYRRYFLLRGRPHQNIDLQWKLGLSSGELFPGEANAYSLGGSKSMRAYDRGTINGNAYALINLQYLVPVFGYKPLRAVAFADIGNAYPSNREFDAGKILWDVGVGLRLRLKSFVKIDLRVDAAWNPENGDWKVFAGTKDVF